MVHTGDNDVQCQSVPDGVESPGGVPGRGDAPVLASLLIEYVVQSEFLRRSHGIETTGARLHPRPAAGRS